MREYLDTKKITALHRVDTRDMLADGLTKGTISRDCLLLALKDGEWRVKHTEQLHSFSSREKPHKDGANTANYAGANTADTVSLGARKLGAGTVRMRT